MRRAQALRKETALDSISPERAGGIMYDTLSYINKMQLLDANPILLSKIYSSVAAMQADAAPVSDITGKALRPGQVVVIVTSSTSSPDYGVVYRYNGIVSGASSWTAVGKIGSSPYLEGYLYAGIATPATDPQTENITQRVFYRAVEPGTYTNFGGIVVNSGEVVNLKFDGSSWSKEVTGEASAASVTELGQKFSIGLPNVGLIRNDGTIQTGYTNWRYSNFVAVAEGQKFTSFARLNDGFLLMAYYDSDKNFLSSSPLASSPSATMDFYSVTIPAGVAYVRAVSAYRADTDSSLPYLMFDSLTVPEVYEELKQNFTNILFSNRGYIRTDGTFAPLSRGNWATTDLISVLPGVSYKAFIMASAACGIAFYDKDMTFLADSSILPSENIFQPIGGVVPAEAAYIRCCTHEYPVSQSYLHIYGPNSFSMSSKYVQQYHNNLQKPYSFEGKKITFFGDSITHGVASDGGTLTTLTTNCYARLLANKLGVGDYENLAVSGSRFAGANGRTASITSVIVGYTGTTDIIWVAGGTNDYQLQSAIGQMGDTTEATLYGALYLCCEHFKSNYPDATVIFATPINWSRAVTEHNIVIEKYRDAIFEMAAKYGFSVVDCSEIGFPMEQTEAGTPAYKAAVIYDGVHPTILGHAMMANNLASKVL